jgi:hypothetical protein
MTRTPKTKAKKKPVKKKKEVKAPKAIEQPLDLLPLISEKPKIMEYKEQNRNKDGTYKSKYQKEFAQTAFIDHFIAWCEQESIPRTVATTDEFGNRTKNFVTIPRVILPSKERFARFIGVYPDSIDNWEKVYPEFKKAMLYLMSIQKDKCLELGSSGIGHQGIHKLVLMSNHGMAEKRETDNKHSFGLLRNLYAESEGKPQEIENVRDVDVFEDN